MASTHFLYVNSTFGAEPFLSRVADVSIVLSKGDGEARDLLTGGELSEEAQSDWCQQPTGEVRIDTQVGRHKYRLLRVDSN